MIQTMKPIHIIIGSQMGAAEYVGDELVSQLESLGHAVTLHEHPDYSQIPQQNVYWLICTATHGGGELPDNISPFISTLKQNRPSLSTLQYGIIGLGDKSYDTFCQAAEDIHQLLVTLGAQLKGEVLRINALDPDLPEEYALNWLPGWLNSL
ncbi:MAG: MioC protein [Alteromonadaceae bacterium]|jgi:MioC protein